MTHGLIAAPHTGGMPASRGRGRGQAARSSRRRRRRRRRATIFAVGGTTADRGGRDSSTRSNSRWLIVVTGTGSATPAARDIPLQGGPGGLVPPRVPVRLAPVVGFFLAGAALAATGLLVASSLRLPSTVEFLVGWWLVVCAEVVAASEVLSLAHAIRPLGYALFETVALALALGAWLRQGAPLPSLPGRRELRLGPVVALLALVVGLAFGYELFLVASTPPNNWDSMHYHLARVAAWHAQGSLAYIPTHNGIENAYPQNAELLVLWTVVFLGRDLLAALPQLLAGLATAGSVYVIARRLRHGARSAALSALLFPTLTIVALESVTTQNDLVEASFVVAAVAFALGQGRATAVLAGLALGLAAGTKLTFLYALAPLVAIGLLALPRRRLAGVAAAAVAGFALVGAYAYVQNLVETGRPQGRASQLESMPPAITVGGTASSVLRTTYRLIDLSGFHVPPRFTEHVSGAAKSVFDGLGIPPNPPESTTSGTFEFGYGVNAAASEDSSAFGPLGFLLLVPLSLGFLAAWAMRRTDRTLGAFALALPLYVVGLALGTRWNLYVDRFLVTPAALTLPLAPAALRRIPLRVAAAGVGTAALALALAYDTSKPTGLGGTTPVWSLSRPAAQSIRWPELRPVLEAVAARVPADARLGVDLAPLDWEYPLWGPRLGRRLVWLPRQPSAGLDWVVLGTDVAWRPPGTWCGQGFPASHWTLLHRC
jgi:Glycosyltransferase family 87